MTTKGQGSSPKKAKATKKATAAKRKPTAGSRKKASGPTTAAAAEAAAAVVSSDAAIVPTSAAAVAAPSQAPAYTLVIDNGGDTIKYGFVTDDEPKTISNVTARLQQQWTVLVGDQLSTIQNPNQLIGVTRSTERGIIVNLGNQIQVWKRMLDLLGIAIPLTTDDTAQAFGWKQARSAEAKTAEKNKIPASTCAVLLTVPPHCPRTILDQITLIWMEDFGFSHVGFSTAQIAATHSIAAPPPAINASCIVDVGWSACTVVPTYRHRATNVQSIRRLPIGGRHLINMWKYYCSYRQWNLMDQEWILRDVLEKTGYMALNFKEEMQLARKLPPGRRPFDREYLLPDYNTIFEGEVQIPPALQKAQEDSDDDDNDDDDNDDEDEDSDVREEDMNEEDVELDVGDDEEPKEEKKPKRKAKKAAPKKRKGKDEDDEDGDDDDPDDDEDDDDPDDDEEEDVEAIRKRILKQREEEESRRRALAAERQTLRLTLERFTVPEVLFRPSDGGLPREWAGLADAVVQAIEQSPEHFRPALYRSVHLVGGLSQLPHLRERLEQELRSLAPCEYELCVTISESPKEASWNGAKKLATSSPFTAWSVSREEWEGLSKRGAWKRLTHAEGGAVV